MIFIYYFQINLILQYKKNYIKSNNVAFGDCPFSAIITLSLFSCLPWNQETQPGLQRYSLERLTLCIALWRSVYLHSRSTKKFRSL